MRRDRLGTSFGPFPPLERPVLSLAHCRSPEIAFGASDLAGLVGIAGTALGVLASPCPVWWYSLAPSLACVPLLVGLELVVCAHPGAGSPPLRLREPGKRAPSLPQTLDSSPARLGQHSAKSLVNLTRRQPLVVVMI